MAEKNEHMEDLDKRVRDVRKQSGQTDVEDEEDLEDEDLDSDDSEEDKDDVAGDDDESEDSDEEDEEEESDDDESDDEEDESDEDEDESEDDEDEEDEDEPITKQFNKLRSENRELKRRDKERGEQLLQLAEKVKSYESSGVLPQEFVDAAKEMGISDPKNLQKLSDLILAQADKKYRSVADKAEALDQAIAPILSQQKVNEEWDNFLPEVESAFKGATSSQLKEAKKLMSGLAQSKKYVDKDMDFILYKEREQFEGIFGAPKKKSMMSSKRQPLSLNKNDDDGPLPKIEKGNHDSIMQARKKMRKLGARDDFREDTKDSADNFI